MENGHLEKEWDIYSSYRNTKIYFLIAKQEKGKEFFQKCQSI